MGGCAGTGLKLPGFCVSPASPTGMFMGWGGSLMGMSMWGFCLVLPLPVCQLVGWVLEVCQLVPCDADLDSNSGNLLLNLLNLNSLLQLVCLIS